MAVIARPYTAASLDNITAQDYNDNFDVVYDRLGGVASANSVEIFNSDGAHTPLKVKQTGVGNSQEWLNTAGTIILRVNQVGQLQSLLSTGTSPFSVASTTVVSNLNADLLDGLHASSFVQLVSGQLTLTHASPSILFDDTSAGAANFKLETKVVNGDDSLVIRNVDGALDVLVAAETGEVITSGNVKVNTASPTAVSHLTRKDYVDAKRVTFSITAFFPGPAATTAGKPSFVVPTEEISMTAERLKMTCQSGSVGIETEITWYLNGIAQDTISMINNGVGTVNQNNIADIALSANDIIHFAITSAGNHADISVSLEGRRRVVV